MHASLSRAFLAVVRLQIHSIRLCRYLGYDLFALTFFLLDLGIFCALFGGVDARQPHVRWSGIFHTNALTVGNGASEIFTLPGGLSFHAGMSRDDES